MVELNGQKLELGPDDALPNLKGARVHSEKLTLAPASITFLAFPKAGNAACR
jgi:heparanase